MLLRIVVVTACLAAAALAGRADDIDGPAVLSSFERGGKIMWAILAASMVGCAFVAERALAIRRGAQIPGRLLAAFRDAMASGGVPAAREAVREDPSAMGRVLHAILSRGEGATRRELESVIDDESGRLLYDLRANLRPIGTVASVTPLLGLLGTVFGLIAAFRSAAEHGMDNPRVFAAGIYEALYTTAFGLVVAIPLLILYHLLRNRADNIMRAVEERALAVIADLAGRSSDPTRPLAVPLPVPGDRTEGQEEPVTPEAGEAVAEERAAETGA